MTETESLEERVRELEERVGYLESELGTSVEEERFERKIRSLYSEDFNIGTDNMGYYSAEVTVSPDDLPYVSKRVDEMDNLGWVILESGENEIKIEIAQGLVNG